MASTRILVPTDVSTAQPELLAQELHKSRPGITLYFGGDQWRKIQVFGRFMWLPPDLGGKVALHPSMKDKSGNPLAVVGDGRIQVKDDLGYVYTRVPGIPSGPPIFGPLTGQDVIAKVRFIVGKFPYVQWLPGDSRDAEAIARAREAWRGSRILWAREIMGRRRAFIEDFKRNNPGIQPPPPTAKQNEAQRVLDNDVGGNAWKAYPCRYLDAHYDSFGELQAHMKAVHNEILEAPKGSAEAQAQTAQEATAPVE